MSKIKKEKDHFKRIPYPSKGYSVTSVLNESKGLLTHPSSTHLTLRQCLARLADLVTPVDAGDTLLLKTPLMTPSSSDILSILKILRDYSRHFDSRVRAASLAGLLQLHHNEVKLDLSLYSEFCEALNDDYEECRVMAIKLLHALTITYGDCLVCVSSGDEQIRLVDDAFARICSMISDLSLLVRTEAASLLGSLSTVSPHFLEQTLDKKLMSNLRKKKSAHERNREASSAGEWSSGKKWADDAPQEAVCPEEVNLMDIGSCGAFIHGLEDEFLQVRMATLESLGQLAKHFPSFATQSLDFLIDMFNDEIEEIRLKAIQVLSLIGLESIVLRDDQIQVILAAFEDYSVEIREALYDMLGNSRVASEASLTSCVETLQINLQKHPEDRLCIWKCLKNLGRNHVTLVSKLVRELLGIHPFLDLPEPNIEDNSYISLMMLILNAAADESFGLTITSQLEHYSSRHYRYLRHTFPDLLPVLSVYEKDTQYDKIPSRFPKKIRDSLVSDSSTTSVARKFLCDIFQRIRVSIENKPMPLQTQVIELSIQDLTRLRDVEKGMSSACHFLILYLDCQLSIRRILANSNWINALLLSPLQSSIFRSSLQKILLTTFHLNHKFHGIHPFQTTLIQQTRVKALALQLMAIIHGSNASALSLCDAFLEELTLLKKLLDSSGIKGDSITLSMIKNISQLEEPKPGSVARVLQPLFLRSDEEGTTISSHFNDLSQMACQETIDCLEKMTVSEAEILEPQPKSDVVIRFTAGLVLCVKLHAIVKNIKDHRMIRVKVKFPDQRIHLFVPKESDFREIGCDASAGVKSYRLHSNVFLSHSVWTEACHVEMSLVLDFKETSSSLTISQVWAAKTGSYSVTGNMSSKQGIKSSNEENMLIDLHSPPVKLNICPRPPRKTVL